MRKVPIQTVVLIRDGLRLPKWQVVSGWRTAKLVQPANLAGSGWSQDCHFGRSAILAGPGDCQIGRYGLGVVNLMTVGRVRCSQFDDSSEATSGQSVVNLMTVGAASV